MISFASEQNRGQSYIISNGRMQSSLPVIFVQNPTMLVTTQAPPTLQNIQTAISHDQAVLVSRSMLQPAYVVPDVVGLNAVQPPNLRYLDATSVTLNPQFYMRQYTPDRPLAMTTTTSAMPAPAHILSAGSTGFAIPAPTGFNTSTYSQTNRTNQMTPLPSSLSLPSLPLVPSCTSTNISVHPHMTMMKQRDALDALLGNLRSVMADSQLYGSALHNNKEPKCLPPPLAIDSIVDDKQQVQQHDDQFPCTVCGRVFKHKSNLKTHGRLHDANAPQCRFCGKKFARVSNLKQHERVHTNERPFKCRFCPKQFKQSHSLNDHIRTHTGEKPFRCDLCDKAFSVKHNMLVHRRIHTGEKPYVCDVCYKPYSSKSGLNSHVRKHHPL